MASSSPTLDERDRRVRRAAVLADLAEARALRERLAPRRARLARAREMLHTHLLRLG